MSNTDSDPDLYDQWQANKDRPAWVQTHRDELMAATDLDDIPRSRSAIDAWLRRKKGVVTRRLAPDGDSSGSTADSDHDQETTNE